MSFSSSDPLMGVKTPNAPFSVVLTDCPSMIATEGVARRPAFRRVRGRKVPIVLGLEELGKSDGQLISGVSSGPPASSRATRTFEILTQARREHTPGQTG